MQKLNYKTGRLQEILDEQKVCNDIISFFENNGRAKDYLRIDLQKLQSRMKELSVEGSDLVLNSPLIGKMVTFSEERLKRGNGLPHFNYISNCTD